MNIAGITEHGISRIACAVVAFMLAGGQAAPPDDPPSQPASAADTHPAVSQREKAQQAAQPFIDAIRQADTPGAAMAAYAKGSSIDRGNIELNGAYMRRMLQLGLPQFAVVPARMLRQADRGDSLAPAVIGYMLAVENRHADAMEALSDVVETRKDDDAVMHNLGTLLGWLDEQNPEDIPDRLKMKVAAARTEWEKIPACAAALAAVRKGVKSLGRPTAELRAAQKDARAKADSIGNQGAILNRNWTRLNESIQEEKRQINRLHHRRGELSAQIDAADDDAFYLRQQRQHILADMHAREDRLARLNEQAADMKKEADELNAALREAKKRAAAAGAEVDAMVVRLRKVLEFKPPSVGGISATQLTMPAEAPATLPADAERAAESQISLARLYVNNGMTAKAVETLQMLIEAYPQTKAAQRARSLLAEVSTNSRPAD